MSSLEDLDRPDGCLSLVRGDRLPSTGCRPVHEIVAELGRTRPAATAVRSGDSRLSYAELDIAAGAVAARLTAAGVGPDSRVALLAEPSIPAIVGLLGVLRSAAAYVPIDPAQPDLRIGEVLADARVAAAVVTGAMRTRIAGAGCPVVCVGDVMAADPDAAAPAAAGSASDAAYVIYTSGSTGEPKPVLVEHRQLAASTLARRAVYPDAPVFLLVSPLAFDSSMAGIWGTLTTGGCLVVATADEVRDAERLVGLVARHRVTTMLCIPSLYKTLLDVAERLGAQALRSLDTVIVAGEALPETLVDRHFAVLGQTALVNEYGPTETTVWATFHRFAAPTPVSIGGPVPGVNLYVLDRDLRPVPHDAEGELFIGGVGVARGYFDRPGATAQAFIPDPFAGQNGARMYRTGDVVRCNEAGELDFLGRRDDQVKIRGYRVELGAVAAGLRGIPDVKEAIVLPDGDRTRLLAFVVATAGTTPSSVRREAADRMPPAMVPSGVYLLDRFPLMLSGKVDLGRLRQVAERHERPVTTAVLGDGLSRRVAAAWSEVLGVSEVPVDANFFDLGGHSLAIFKLQEALQRHVGIRPPMVALFQHTTVTAQTALIRDGGAGLRETGS
jgi:amino acid adenylation domain-containing protein